MYESRHELLHSFDSNSVCEFVSKLKGENPAMPATTVLQSHANFGFMPTKFGAKPLGSPISFQYPLVPHRFNVSCTIKWPDEIPETEPIFQFPRFPLSDGTPLLTEYLSEVTEKKQLEILNQLKVTVDQANIIEKSTRDQSKNPLWRKERLFRFTASKCKTLKEKKHLVDFLMEVGRKVSGCKK